MNQLQSELDVAWTDYERILLAHNRLIQTSPGNVLGLAMLHGDLERAWAKCKALDSRLADIGVTRRNRRFRSEAPGSEGRVDIMLSDSEYQVVERLCKEFNRVNPGHASPLFTIETIP